jgi:hypothetical protein
MSVALASRPEKFVDRLRDRLALHALWQAALVLLPPLLAAWYAVFFLYRFAWVGADAVLITDAALLVAAGIATAALSRRHSPSRRSAARLIDETIQGQDRFVTLATIDPAVCPPELLSRLEAEAAAFQSRIEVRRDFPFRPRRSFLNSCVGALIALLLFHLIFELAPILRPEARATRELALVAEQLSRFPGLEKLADSLKTAAAKLSDPAVSGEEKRALIEQLTNEINRQPTGGGQGSGGGEDLLRQAGNQLSGLEEGLDQGKDRGSGAGGSRAQTSQQKSGAGNRTGDGAEAEKQQDALKFPMPSPSAKDQTIPDSPSPSGPQLKEGGEKEGKKTSQEVKGAGAGRGPNDGLQSKNGEGTGARSQSGKETPQRFLRPGEQGPAAPKDARFVIVQLPEEETAPASDGEGNGKRNKVAGTNFPAANTPLGPADRPDAADEKQMLPLEYRGMIR